MPKKIILSFILLAALAETALAVYGNGAWLYRKTVDISSATAAGANYPVQILVGESAGTGGATVNVDGHSLTATIFNDLRFTASDGNTELSYWRQSVSGNAPNQIATCWVKVPADLSSGATTIYIYYGNAAAADVSTTTTVNLWTETSATDFNDGTTAQVKVSGSGNGAGLILNNAISFSTWTAKVAWNSPKQDIASPALADLDNDGDKDLLLGSDYGLSYGYENIGTSTAPAWSAKTAWNTVDTGRYPNPAFADLDGDGDQDILIGDANGPSYGYENISTSNSPVWSAKPAWDMGSIGGNAHPAFADLDGDGDQDLLMGSLSGFCYGYQNIGTSTAPAWSSKAAWNTIDVGSWSAPTLADLDGDGDQDLLIGDVNGLSYGYENSGSVSTPTWSAKAAWNNVDIGGIATPTFVDFDGDGDQDLLIGTDWAGTFGYENVSTTTYSASGNYISSTKDTGQNSAFISIVYSAASLPSGTTVKFQLAANNDQATWNYGSSTYTVSGQNISSGLNGNRYLKYKAFLDTSNTALTPNLADVTIYYRKYVSPEPQPSVSSAEEAIDTSAPLSSGATVYDGTGADISYTASSTTLSANWAGFSDPQSGISKYWYALGSTQGGTEKIGWTEIGTTAITRSDLSLPDGSYYFTVKAENAYGILSTPVNSDGQKLDTTPPGNIGYLYDGTGASDVAYTTSTTQLSANWGAANELESTIAKYWYGIGLTAGATNVLGWTNNGTSCSVTQALALTQGGAYYFTVKAENGAGLLSGITNSNGVTVDSTTASNIAAVFDGLGADLAYTTDLTRLSANWSASSDAQSGIAKYWYAIGATPGASEISGGWISTGTVTAVTKTGLNLSGGGTYYFSLKVENGAGLVSSVTSSNGIVADNSAPGDIATVYDGAVNGSDYTFCASTSQLSANWTASLEPESGIATYYYRIGTTSGGNQIVDWTPNGTATFVTKTGLALTNGGAYYFTVKAVNGAGVETLSSTSSNGQTVDITLPDSASASVRDGLGVDIAYSSSTSQLSANWSGFSDAQSGVAKYWYAIGITPGGITTTGTWLETTTAFITKTGLSLTAGVTYYFTVKAENGGGGQSAAYNSTGQLVDDTAPGNSFTVKDGLGADINYTTSTVTLSANWTAASDPQSGIAQYWYAISSTTAGGADFVNWTNNGLLTTITKSGAFTLGTTYYFSVKAENNAGGQSAAVNSNGQTVDTTPPANIAAVNDGLGEDSEYTNSLTQLSANWTASTDAQSGIARYWYCIGATENGVDIAGWTDAGSTTTVTRGGLALTQGVTYYFTVKAENGAGYFSASPKVSDGQCVTALRQIVFIADPVTVPAGSYSTDICTVQIRDENNQPLNVDEITTLTLQSSSGEGIFSPDGTNPNNEITLLVGNNSASFYYKDTIMGNPTITVRNKNVAWWIPASQQETVACGNASHFTITVAASGDCGVARAVTVTAQDIYNNTVSSYTGTVNLSSSGNIVLTPASIAFAPSDNGIKSVQAMDYYVESALINAVDAGNNTITGVSSSIAWDGVKVTPVDLAPTTIKQGLSDIGILKLNLASSNGSATLQTIKIRKTGSSALDSDISAVKLYQDDGNGTFEPAKDTLVGSGVFAAGAVSFTGLNAAISATAKIYYLAYDLSLNASADKTVGAELTDTSFITCAGKNVGKNNFPISSKLIAIETLPRTMNLRPESKISAEIQQGAEDLVVEKYTVRSASGTVSWTKMGLSLSGSGADSDINAVKFYHQDNFGSSTLSVDGGVQATLISSGVFVNGAVSLAFSSAQSVGNSEQVYYLAYDIANQASVGASIGASGVASNFDLGAVNQIDQTYLPYSSDLGTITPTIDTVTVTSLDLAALQVKQGSTTKAWAKLSFQTTENSALLRSIKIKKLGALADSAVRAIKIYKDDPASSDWIDLGGGASTQVTLVSSGSDLFSGGEAVISLTAGELIELTAKNFYLLPELSEEAEIGATLGLEITQEGISLDSPDLVSASGLPFSAKLTTITDNPDKLTVTGANLLGSGKSLVQGRETAVLKLSLTVNHDKIALQKIKLKKLGNCLDSDIEKIKICADANSSGSYDSADRLLNNTAAVFSSGTATVSFTAAEEVSLSKTPTLFVVLLIRQTAEAGKTAGIEISDSSYLETALPDTVETANFPFTSSISAIKDLRTPTTPVVIDDGVYTVSKNRLHFLWSASVEEGSIGECKYAIGTTTGGIEVVGWTSIASNSELTRIDLALENTKLYYLSVKVKNSLGDYWSDVGISDGITVDLVKPKLNHLPEIVELTKKGTATDVVLQWTVPDVGVSGVAKYELQIRDAKSPLWKTVKTMEVSSSPSEEASSLTTGAHYSSNSTFDGLSSNGTSLTYLVEGVLSGTYYYRVRAENGAGVSSDWSEMSAPVIVGDLPSELMTEVSNYPNPFDSRKTVTKINLTLNQHSQIKIIIYDLLGYLVREFNFDGNAGSDNNQEWDGTDDSGRKVAQGMYLFVIEAEGDDGSKSKTIRRVGVIH